MDKKLGVFVAKGIMVMALVLLVILTGRVNTQKEEMELLVERVSVLEDLVIDINVNRNNIDEIRNTVFDVKEDVSANQEVIDNNKEYINTNQEIIDELSDKIQEWTSRRLILNDDELELLEVLVMEEMGSDWISLEGKIHVASVIINRVLDSSYPNTLYGVAYQPSQFDVVTRGMIYSQEPTDSVKKAVEIALKNDTTNGCLGFLVVENSNPKNVENIMKWNDVLFEKDGVSFTKPKE